MKRRLMQSAVVALCLLLVPVFARAGGGSFKERIQSKISSQKADTQNVQYQPYYLEQNYQVDKDQAVNDYWGTPQGQEEQLRQAGAVGGSASQVMDAGAYRQNVNMPQSAPVTANNERARRESDIQQVSQNFIVYTVYYSGEVEESVVTVKGEIVFEVFSNGGRPVEIPLVNNQVGLIDVQVNRGKSFVMNKGNKYYLVIDKPGRYTLNMEYLLKAKREREHGPGSFRIDVMPAPISQFEFVIPEEDVQVFIEPAIKVETKNVKGTTEAWAVMPNTNGIDVRWTKALPKETIEAVELAPKLYAETWTFASIGGGVVQCQSRIQFSILQAEVSNLRVALPEDVSVLSVSSQEMRDWKVSKKDNVQYLDVFLNFGTKGTHILDVTFERNVDEGQQVVSMPWLRALNVERENGFYGIAASTNLEIDVGVSERVTKIDAKQLPQYIWEQASMPILLAFKYLNHPISIEIEMTRHEEIPVLVAAIDAAYPETLVTKDGRLLTKLVYQVRNNVKQYLRIKLPDTAKVWSSFVNGQPVKPAKDKDGNILISLKKSQNGGSNVTQFPVEVVYLDEGKAVNGAGKLNLKLPAVDLPVNQLIWKVYMPDDFIYFGSKSDGEVEVPYAAGIGGRLGYLNRGVQGRMRMAADDIGDQYEVQQVMMEKKEKSVASFVDSVQGTQGLLPIKIDLPTRGNGFTVSKLLVVEGDQPWMSVSYFPWGKTARGSLKFAKIGLFFLIFVLIVVRIRSKKKRKVQAQE